MIRKISLVIAVIMLLSAFINVNIVNATDFGSVVQEANDWITQGETKVNDENIIDSGQISGIIKPIAQALTTIGVGILLIVAAIMGIKWITANPEEQAKLKQQSVGLVVAAVVILGAYTIWAIALRIVSSF